MQALMHRLRGKWRGTYAHIESQKVSHTAAPSKAANRGLQNQAGIRLESSRWRAHQRVIDQPRRNVIDQLTFQPRQERQQRCRIVRSTEPEQVVHLPAEVREQRVGVGTLSDSSKRITRPGQW